MKNYFLILLALFLTSKSYSQEYGFPFVKNYLPSEYKADAQNWYITENKQGILYIGNTDGEIIEYDGEEWRHIPIGDFSTCRSLLTDKDGKIWVGTKKDFGYLEANSIGKMEYIPMTDLIKDSTIKVSNIWKIHEIEERIFFYTKKIIFVWDKEFEKLTLFNAETKFRNIIFSNNGVYYNTQRKIGLTCISDDSIYNAPGGYEFIENNIDGKDCFKNKDHFIMTTTQKGIFNYYLNPFEGKYLKKIETPIDSFLTNNKIYYSARNSNRYLFTTLGDGGMLTDTNFNPVAEINTEHGLVNNIIYRVNKTSDDNFWLSLSSGFAKVSVGNPVTRWYNSKMLEGGVYDIERINNTIYFLTEDKIVYLKGNKLHKVENVPDGQCWTLFKYTNPENPEQEHLLAGFTYGIYEIKNNKAEMLYDYLYASAAITSPTNPNLIYFACDDNVATIEYENGKFNLLGFWDFEEDIRSLRQDAQNNVWLSTYSNGIYKVNWENKDSIGYPYGFTSKLYTTENGLPSVKGVNCYEFNNDIVFGSIDGLYYYNTESDNFEKYHTQRPFIFDEDPKDLAYFQQGSNGDIWFMGEKNIRNNIMWGQKTEDGYSWKSELFNIIPEQMMYCIYPEDDGIVWIGGIYGVYRFDSNKYIDTSKPIQTLIRKVKIGSDSIIYWGGFSDTKINHKNKIDFKHNSISINFALPFITNEESNEYSFMLENYDKKWTNWATTNYKEYTNLNEGRYTFKVKSINIYNQISEETTFSFTISPPWYRTILAYIIYFSL